MTTVMPQSELVRKAALYIGEMLREGKDLRTLLDEAGMRFNLSPKEAEALRHFFQPANGEE